MSTTSGLHLHRFYHMGGHILKEVNDAKYLGVILSNDLTWSKHIAEVVKGNKNIYCLNSCYITSCYLFPRPPSQKNQKNSMN